MDLLFCRYASPFLLLDEVITNGRFCEFIDEFMESENEDKLWQYYLHKVFDQSFTDFKESINSAIPDETSDEKLETTIEDSKNMLNNFIPN